MLKRFLTATDSFAIIDYMSKTIKTIEWFAGLFEGEGCIYRNDKKRILVMTIKMTDEDVIREVLKVVKVGRIVKRKPFDNPNWKQIYEWVLTTRNEIIDLSQGILPFLGKRRSKKIKEALEGLKKLPPKRKLKIVKSCGLVKPTEITSKGAKYHLKRGEKPCKECAQANRNYLRKWRKAFFEANK